MNKLFEKWAAEGVTRQAAQAYIDWLDEQNDEEPNQVRFAYLTPQGIGLDILPEIKQNWLGRIWGIEVAGTYWCRWHTDMFELAELEKWRTKRVLASLQEVNLKGSDYERIRAEYFFNIAGSSDLQYGIPNVEDFEKVYMVILDFTRALKELENRGCIVQDWFLDEGYWAYDADTKKLVVFDLKKGKVIPFKENEMYALRPVWIK